MARTQRPHRRVAVSAAARSVAADSGLGYVAGHGAQTRVRSLPLRALALLEGVRHRGFKGLAGLDRTDAELAAPNRQEQLPHFLPGQLPPSDAGAVSPEVA